MSIVQEIIRALPKLSGNELLQVQAACKIQAKSKPQSPGKVPVSDEDWLLYGIIMELERRGLEPVESKVKFIIKENGYRSFIAGSAVVRKLLIQAAPGLTAVENRALGIVAGRELARFLEGRRYPDKTEVNKENMLCNVRLVPEAMSASFPGYLESRMLGVVIRKGF